MLVCNHARASCWYVIILEQKLECWLTNVCIMHHLCWLDKFPVWNLIHSLVGNLYLKHPHPMLYLYNIFVWSYSMGFDFMSEENKTTQHTQPSHPCIFLLHFHFTLQVYMYYAFCVIHYVLDLQDKIAYSRYFKYSDFF